MIGLGLRLVVVVLIIDNISAIPRRGNEPWSLILCKFADLPNYEPKPTQFFRDWLSGPDNGWSWKLYFFYFNWGF